MENDILIVDAYNMIGSWPDLNRLKLSNRLEDARCQLLDILSEYRKYQQVKVIVVFDAMFVPGISKTYIKYGMEIVWTGQYQTADAYIETLAKEKKNKFKNVMVATSDQAEQWMIFSEGALRIPAGELLRYIQQMKKEIKSRTSKYHDLGQVRRLTWDQEQLTALEKLRDELDYPQKR